MVPCARCQTCPDAPVTAGRSGPPAQRAEARFRFRRVGKVWRYTEATLRETPEACVGHYGRPPVVAEFDWWRQRELALAQAGQRRAAPAELDAVGRNAKANDANALDPEKGWKVTLVLADAAQVAEDKLNVLGAGWNITDPMPSPFALGGIIEVPWNETNRSHPFRLELIDLDGNPVVMEGLEGSTEVAVNGTFEIGRPSGIRAGSFQPFPFAVNCGPDAVAARPPLRVAVQH